MVSKKKSNESRVLCQYFTENENWLLPQVEEFIRDSGSTAVLDPFAGQGHLLNVVRKRLGYKDIFGYDIDMSLGWPVNDSLRDIPTTEALILTNPPYLQKASASRQNMLSLQYFEASPYGDLYLVAMKKCLAAARWVVAIIPQSYLLAENLRERLVSLSVLTDNPFSDTETAVCVACYGPNPVISSALYVGNEFIGTVDELVAIRTDRSFASQRTEIRFNEEAGQMGLIALDGVRSEQRARFCRISELPLPICELKKTGRHIVSVSLSPSPADLNSLIERANEILEEIRARSRSLVLTPFRGRNHEGVWRRRLDFALARQILLVALAQANVENGSVLEENVQRTQ